MGKIAYTDLQKEIITELEEDDSIYSGELVINDDEGIP
ncbi:hypothetical protein ALNOE001_03020 [Candidatus Methanobinarius endosymbioticus]|uniref:Uncharacterized protein n=1 Tax=Candidatus Methanobinarius endosymbioticus TaxID=2006182 RepID=A0A366MFT8_9EURY|nr:hypothetical protein ALNOE001_03020 [Candidatus Methanobinarius endosymbioticus]